MLKEIGLKDIDELFSDIPEEIRIKDLNLPEGSTEEEVVKKLREISKKNKPFPDLLSFLGGGIKPHYVPSAVKHILMRSEFYTSYTPYQPEASQGILQAMFEYQSIISELTGMDIANCSLYDMSTSLGEAVRMCMRINRKKRILIPRNISWERKSVLKNYIAGLDAETVEVDYDRESGRMDISDLERKIDNETCCLYVENPNYFGIFEEDVEEISEIVHG
ncbi:MAG: aminomethyl-transferring glycine dehydrogenase, partial [Thermoplasmata archaeon]